MVLTLLQLSLAAPPSGSTLPELIDRLGPTLFTFGWLLVVFLIMWIAWETYLILKMIDYTSAIQWTYLQITLPETSEETPKNMEIAYEIFAGMHKGGDLNEKYFDGYLEAWYSCELHVTAGHARYIMVVPTAHRKTFEGVIYGQYPKAEIKEVADYTQRYRWQDLRKTFDLYGAELILVADDIYPIKTYREYEASLAEEERFVDPHQGMVEAFLQASPGEEYWFQMLVRPMDAKDIKAWSEKGQLEVSKISGQAKEDPPGLVAQTFDYLVSLPGAFLNLALGGEPAEEKKEEKQLRFFNPVDEARMKGILQKVSQSGHKVKMRIIHIAPVGQLQKPNIGRAIGAFKQFNTWHLNSLKPDGSTKSNGPNYIMKDARRYLRERKIFLNYQWRDFFGYQSGQWLNAEELATLYHFPVKYVRAPGVERAKAGRQAPPDNLPYA